MLCCLPPGCWDSPLTRSKWCGSKIQRHSRPKISSRMTFIIVPANKTGCVFVKIASVSCSCTSPYFYLKSLYLHLIGTPCDWLANELPSQFLSGGGAIQPPTWEAVIPQSNQNLYWSMGGNGLSGVPEFQKRRRKLDGGIPHRRRMRTTTTTTTASTCELSGTPIWRLWRSG